MLSSPLALKFLYLFIYISETSCRPICYASGRCTYLAIHCTVLAKELIPLTYESAIFLTANGSNFTEELRYIDLLSQVLLD